MSDEIEPRDLLHFCPRRYDEGVVVPTGILGGPGGRQQAGRVTRQPVEHDWMQRFARQFRDEDSEIDHSLEPTPGLDLVGTWCDDGYFCSKCLSTISVKGQLSYADAAEVEQQEELRGRAEAEAAAKAEETQGRHRPRR